MALSYAPNPGRRTLVVIPNPSNNTSYKKPQDTSLVSPMIVPSPTSMAGVLSLTGVGAVATIAAGLFTTFAKGVYRKNGLEDNVPKDNNSSNPVKPVSPIVPSVPLTPNAPLNISLSESNKMSKALIQTLNDGFILASTVLYEGFIAKRDSDDVKNIILGQIANELAISNEINTAYQDAHLQNSISSLENSSNALDWEGYKFGALEDSAVLASTFQKDVQDTTNAYNELTQQNQLKLNVNLEALVEATKKTKEELELVAKKLDYFTKETTEIQLDNFGDNIPALSPQMYKSHYYATAGKKHSDENTFELDDDDYNSMFNMPDLSELLKYPRITDYLSEVNP